MEENWRLTVETKESRDNVAHLKTVDVSGMDEYKPVLLQRFFVCGGLMIQLVALAGLLFTHWIADSLTLWKSPSASDSDLRLWTAATYYSILSRMPPTLAYIYAVVAVLGGSTLFWSLGDLRAGNLMFDGGSICK
ncbi:hypothetical protein PHLCEN_2v2047 [Hermanssonia centrifuga]|uniref:Uncharacterized protein n=1 Tax=Hermanssonia centrifuga TaxID=98765 RepID=A0A2R6RQ90_9APHY|nr:hypothetical protein PHLCEN_2v2047 [Hermanssonia centrifuga]